MKSQLLAQKICINGSANCITGPLDPSIQSLGDVINRVMQFLIPLASVILLLVLIWGGYDYLMSQGNPEKIKAGQAKITSALFGFILLFVSYVLVRLIAFIFGLGGGII